MCFNNFNQILLTNPLSRSSTRHFHSKNFYFIFFHAVSGLLYINKRSFVRPAEVETVMVKDIS